ncbi:rhamnogalacturonidase [Granulicella sibirica]|uniref:Polygalacturonase n=1 Tax=Granulicella sibirica TaxID=2479048 RepID=A0A4Q0SX30_9BACT|nr:glycoside hydrolase family 28 protein [Granulicella sibirica]RXH54520.1 Polygalacturonase [Granulicella sibirica]
MKTPATRTSDSSRRDLLKLSGLGLAAAAATLPSSAFAGAQSGAASPLLFDVRIYGATGNGKSVDTAAINKAIEAAAAAGGGTVFFPAGNYLSFSIHLRSFVHLYLAQGAVLIAADSPKPGETTGYQGGTYDPAEPNTSITYGSLETYQDFGHNHWHNSLLWGENLHDLSITGPGRIWGRGLSHGRGRDKLDVPFVAEQAGVGNKVIALKNCYNVIFRDFQILKAGHFGMLLTGVDNLTIDNLTIDTDRDGMDIDCCKNVRVSNCTVNSPWDDGICPKSSFSLGYNRPTENLTITNCFVTGTYQMGTVLDGTWKKFPEGYDVPRTGRIKCGTESNGGFKNITISNCVFEGCMGLALESEDGALCEDITVSNITMRDIVYAPLFVRLGSRLRGPKQVTQVGTARRILISNVTSYNAGSRVSSIFSGIPGYSIEDVKIANVLHQHKGGGTAAMAALVPPENEAKYPDPGMFGTTASHGFLFRHVNRLELSHVEIQPMVPDARPSFSLLDVHRADFYAITAPTSPTAFALNKVTDLRILFSRAAPDTHLDTADNKTI